MDYSFGAVLLVCFGVFFFVTCYHPNSQAAEGNPVLLFLKSNSYVHQMGGTSPPTPNKKVSRKDKPKESAQFKWREIDALTRL